MTSLLSTFKHRLSSLRSRVKRLRSRDGVVRQFSRGEAHAYWCTPPPQENQPQNYILGRDGRAPERSHYLADVIASESPKSDSILEIGCNVGRNLNALHLKGFHDLWAIEISTDALELLKKTYPDMAKVVHLYEGPVEEWIGRFADAQFDVVFTMAVLQHIHPDSDFLFKEIARITRKRLIVMESETHATSRTFPRNYKKVFEKVGMVQVFQDTRVPGFTGWCRVFRHRD